MTDVTEANVHTVVRSNICLEASVLPRALELVLRVYFS